jgi:hypothetical protein
VGTFEPNDEPCFAMYVTPQASLGLHTCAGYISYKAMHPLLMLLPVPSPSPLMRIGSRPSTWPGSSGCYS